MITFTLHPDSNPMNAKRFPATEILSWTIMIILLAGCSAPVADPLRAGFLNPPDSARPGVYWYFDDGCLHREQITADLEAMKEAGIGYALYQEVSNEPRGEVDFLSPRWQELFAHIIHESERLGIRIILGASPGWTGSGGPWIKPEQSMQFLVASRTEIMGPGSVTVTLPVPGPKYPYRNPRGMGEWIIEARDGWFKDVAVLAIPSQPTDPVGSIDDKALYYRNFYSWIPGVIPWFIPSADFSSDPSAAISPSKVMDISGLLNPDGTLTWNVPPGKWTLLRFVRRSNGRYNVPAPAPGLGLECDKFDSTALNAHWDQYIGMLLHKIPPHHNPTGGGWYGVHVDSWEVGAQNWTKNFREEFRKSRGYDPLPFLPVLMDRTIGSKELTERFLWDLRQTGNELIVNQYGGQIRKRASAYGLHFTLQAYDSNPSADLDLFSCATQPSCEFWSQGFVTFNSTFSCVEAASSAHVNGQPVVVAEAFTADDSEAWRNYPGIMKNQGDWALTMGINRMFYHTFVHKVHGDQYRPGLTMGPWGTHWDRTQTWWPMVGDYHRYITRCQYVLSQGTPKAEILYLAGEGAPHPFLAPVSAFGGDTLLPDKKGYAFDGCSPKILMKKAAVKDHRIVFPGGTSYGLLVLPSFRTMTPELLIKIDQLVKDGAYIVGNPPVESPSLSGWPDCDQQVRDLAIKLWGSLEIPDSATERPYGEGKIFRGGNLDVTGQTQPLRTLKTFFYPVLYPPYDATSAVLAQINIKPDFISGGSIRYIHKSLPDKEIYFVSNRTDKPVTETCTFRDGTLIAERWDPLTGEIVPVTDISETNAGVEITIDFAEFQSFFVVFDKSKNKDERLKNKEPLIKTEEQRPETQTVKTLEGSWVVSFDPRWGGPESVVFDELTDWAQRPEEGIRYYSGIATYSKTFDLSSDINQDKKTRLFLNLGTVKVMARVKLNGKDLGVFWCAPWQVEITKAVRSKKNRLEIEVANLWPNRLIGDENEPDDGVVNEKWPEWLLNGTPRPTKRYTFTTYHPYKKGDPLLESGLLGPVTISTVK